MFAKIMILGFSGLIIVVSFLIGLWARKKVTSDEAFIGGAKIFGPVAIGLSTMAAVASAFAVVGVPGVIYKSGNTMLLFMMASVGFAFGYIVIGKKIRAIAELGTVASLGDISDLRYNNHRGIKMLLSLTVLAGCVAYLASQVLACSMIFSLLLGVKPFIAGLIIFGILIVYTIISGEIGGILTQAFQGFVMVVAGLIIVISFFIMLKGFSPVLDAVANVKNFGANHLNAWGTLPKTYSLAWVLLPTIGIMCQPQVLTRMLSLKNPMDLPRLSLFATTTNMIVCFMVMTIGYSAVYLVAVGLIPPFSNADDAVFKVADFLGIIAQLFVYAAILAASMSTASLFLSLSGGIISRDVSTALGFKLSLKKQKVAYQITIVAVGFGAILFGLGSGKLVAILGTFGFGALMSATFPVLIVGLLWKKATKEGVLIGSLISFIACIAFMVLTNVKVNGAIVWQGKWIPWYIPVICLSIVVTIAVSLFTKGATGDELDKRVEKVIDL